MPKLLNRFGSFNPEFLKIRHESLAMREDKDCGVVALVAVTNLPYAKCHAALKEHGRKNRSGCYLYTVERALRDLGYNMVRVNDADFIRRYPAPHSRLLRSCTSAHPDKFHDVWRDGHNYFVGIRKHWLGIRNGEVIDWSANRCKRFITIHRIEKVGGNTNDYTVSG